MPAYGEALAAKAQELVGRREPFVRATVVRAQHPTSAHAGDTALVLANGEIDGFLGGTCVEASVREYGLQTLSKHEPLLLRVVPGEPSRISQEGAVEVANPCLSGGAVEIFLEPQMPPARVVVVGATPVAQALGALGTILDLDMELTDGNAAEPRADDAALIVASQGRDEEPSLEAALRLGVPYVALVASRTRGAAVLASLDVDDEQRARVHSPAGLMLGGRTPAEIALSILAELVSLRSTGRAAERAPAEPATPEPSTAEPAPPASPTSAVDPVCGMTVAAVEATLHAEYAGTTYYFCSPGCRRAFLAEPERYAAAS
ncbi:MULTISPECIES: XdhC family protein [Arthrobacter]|uniref:YHS domain-containing protein n=1 Tax=Arthrobacter terricola TaxID=2547396 RepID=A0A4R5KKK2_9MICC|nr:MULTISPECIES: XdhC family protein [Arthrobacter]MBT8161305.1 XdhC family protein [Arthrobacter sp. GN70]TDF96099.1 YHS domain-containing protein [Arthrobacter terricola]